MSKSISVDLMTHLSSEVTSIAHCLKLVLKSGAVMGFTDHDKDIVYGGVTYESSTAYNLSSLASSSNLAVDKVDIETVLDSSYITADDLRAGKYDFAEWYLFIVNWRNLTMGKLDLSRGWLGKTEMGKHKYFTEANTVFQAMDQSIVELVAPSCRANLGDARCGINLALHTVSSTVAIGGSHQVFTDSVLTAENMFSHGKLTWTSGLNAGYNMEVKFNTSSGVFTLTQPMPNVINAGDTYTVYRGCDKLLDTCAAVFNNAHNFRGEPWLPGLGRMLKYGKHSSNTSSSGGNLLWR